MSVKKLLPQYDWYRCNNSGASVKRGGLSRHVSVNADAFIREYKIENPVVKGIVKWWFNDHACNMTRDSFYEGMVYSINLIAGAIKVSGGFRYSARVEISMKGVHGSAVVFSVVPPSEFADTVDSKDNEIPEVDDRDYVENPINCRIIKD